MPHATFPCPLCRDFGRVVTLEAALEPEPPLVIVTDLQGACAHAAAFGALEGQTLEEACADPGRPGCGGRQLGRRG